ncbi:Ppx/GppA family phosphatase [Altererythrobacter sp. MF3-039]|uniref:Ppx/GppA phosphatase family protein n=1 Tax=Altererythrobacter sp. MF3-039 TaxID=3252901 RepID=UPI00390C85E7
MTELGPRKARWERRIIHPRRAVIDIGSNTVRLVVYEGPQRAPEVVWNEKVAARLGRDLSTTGLIPEEAWNEALGALARQALIVKDLEVDEIQTVATAAARDASNGAEFLAEVSKLGLEPRLLSGEEEARAAAMGTIGAFPGANGVVADLGGGSLELVSIADGDCHHGATFPLGTLRLPSLRAKDGFGRRVRSALGKAGWAQSSPGPLYMVGGTWRALASYAMHSDGYPLTDPHGFVLDVETAERLCAKLVRAKPDRLVEIGGISPMRAGYLPDAAALLRVMLKEFAPERLVFSAWGLREGLLFDQLDPLQQAKDPLLAGIDSFASVRLATITDATLLAGWTVELAGGNGKDNERYRLAAAQLAMALQRVEPNMRVNHATEWALDKRWIGCDARGKAMICAALFGSLGRTAVPASFRRLASDDDLREALTWGLGFRLARRLGAASRMSLSASSLTRNEERLTLRLDKSRRALAHYPLTLDLEVLASWLDLEPVIETGDFDLE